MKQNKYDDEKFFEKYSKMNRSINGLEGAGEWHELKKLMPDFKGKRVLDLGCGFGWHCRYAADNGAAYVVGVDISEKMLEQAKQKTKSNIIKYICKPIEDIDFGAKSFDIVISSLAFHYIESFKDISKMVSRILEDNGIFIFSVEHPIFTSYGIQDWYYDDNGNKLHWPVDRYFEEGKREAVFLGENVIKYHRTITTYISNLINSGFKIDAVLEPMPEKSMLENNPDMVLELRRPMMLIISAKKGY